MGKLTAGRKIISDNKDWGTPAVYVDAVRKVFEDSICLDPCSSRHSIVDAETEWVPPTDGLALPWDYPRIYVNPPYGIDRKAGTRIADWLRKCMDSHEMYDSEIQALIPVAPNTGHWKKYIFGKASAICFLYDTRLRFLINGVDGGKGAPMACAMVYYGKHHKKFHNVFSTYGAVVNIINLKRDRRL